MGEFEDNSNKNNSILISRNTPVALVVGTAGFIGSNLAETLLLKGNISVIGVDDFSSGTKENISVASRNKSFHFINQPAENLELDIPRLDYIFIVTEGSFRLQNLLDLAKKHHSKILIVSTIELYNSQSPEDLKWLKQAESILAKFASDNNLNARVVRLSAVYGPRMHFNYDDPVISLIKSSLTGDLQKEYSSLDFSSRAIFIDDAVSLIIKSMLSGSTALKIFDGVRPTPVKVAEIKQILMDPLWHEQKEFVPAELPPWPTPNLEKTMQYLSWQPKTNFVKGLKETVVYFKDNEIKIPTETKKIQEEKVEVRVEEVKKEEKFWDLKEEKKSNLTLPKINLHVSKLYLILVLMLVFYALVLPLGSIAWGVYDLKNQLKNSADFLIKGDFTGSLNSLSIAQDRIDGVNNLIDSLDFLRQLAILNEPLTKMQDLVSLTQLTVQSLEHSVLGTQYIYHSLKAVTGESGEDPKELLNLSQVEFSQADLQAEKVYALSLKEDFKQSLFPFEEKLQLNREFIKKGRAAAQVLPFIVAIEGKKSYLVLLQNNGELRPTGGFIGSFAQIDFENGRLKNIQVNDTYNIDGALKIHVEPPKEIKGDMGQPNWFLRDANWEPDFPTAARQAEWFYTQETGTRVDGVIALDVSAITKLLEVIGPIDLPDYQEKIDSGNLFEKAVTYAETGFFPGSQAKKNFLSSLTTALFNKLFFLPNQNWSSVVTSVGTLFEEKHLMAYLDNQKMFSYLVAQNWAGIMPRQTESLEGEVVDFLSVVEANLGGNKANYYLERGYSLQTTIGKDGEVSHRLKINYTNRSPSDTFPAGKYKNRLRVYLPFGTKLNRMLWGEKDITTQASAFSDYGRAGYSILLELQPKESKNLILDYQISSKINFKNTLATYRLNILKQPGTHQDPLEWRITYPISFKVTTEGQKIGPQEHHISTDLSRDRSLQVDFTK